MSFQTNYSNLTVGGNTVSGNLNIANINFGPIGNLTIGDGNVDELLTTDGNGVLSWVPSNTYANTSGTAGSNTQIQFNGPNKVSATSAFAYDSDTKIFTAGNAITTTNINVSRLSVSNVSNLRITSSTATAGQAITSNGNGTVRFDAIAGTSLNATTQQLNDNIRFRPAGVLPAGTTSALIYFTSLTDQRYITVGAVVSFPNDPTYLLTLTSVTPTQGGVIITWDLPLRLPLTTGFYDTNARVLVPIPQLWSNLRITGTLTTSYTANDPIYGNILTIGQPLSQANSQILHTTDGNTVTGSNLFTTTTGGGLTVPNVFARNNTNVGGNIAVSNASANINLYSNSAAGQNTASITTAGVGVYTANPTRVTANTVNATYGYYRGDRLAEYRIDSSITFTVPSGAWTPVVWKSINDNSVVLTPIESTGAYLGIQYWRNNTANPLAVAVSCMIAWPNGGSTDNYRKICFNIDNLIAQSPFSTRQFGLVSTPVTQNNSLVHSTFEIIRLNPNSYFGVYVYQSEGYGITLGQGAGDMTAGYDCKLNFYVLN